ncbi:MAG TPA: S-adenosyl-l-methionine hydroxide adenosyltransferase family protein [Candidatus Dormibacteraeota bacterium]|nr:S-adenosyl-l-methionine hydroxide adenosyltransferase family protein [Candidatus Dormibacteraeota bacterium]
MVSRTRLSGSALLALAFLANATWNAQAQEQATGAAIAPSAQRATIVFMTDFGTANDAVAICKAVIIGIAPDIRLMDITHQVTPFQIEEAARFLTDVTLYYPSGTVFLVVVDPGVGTSRKAIIVKSKKGQYFVLPDNGVVTPVIERDGLESAHEITNRNWMIQAAVSSTFHGRDIFSPAAAHLATGWNFKEAGPEVPKLVRLTSKIPLVTEKGIAGEIIGLDDPFGSLITDIPGDEFKKLGYELGEKITLQIDKTKITIPYVKTFMDVPIGEPLLYIDSRGHVGIAVNQGNYGRKFNISPAAKIFIPRKGASVNAK